MDPSLTPLLPPPPGITSNFVNPPSCADATIWTGSITLALAVLFFLTRLYSSIRFTHSAAYDDYVCAMAIVSSAVYLGIVISARMSERHVWDTPTSIYTADFMKVSKAIFGIASAFLTISPESICVLYRPGNWTFPSENVSTDVISKAVFSESTATIDGVHRYGDMYYDFSRVCHCNHRLRCSKAWTSMEQP